MADKTEKKVFTKTDVALQMAETLGISKTDANISVNGIYDIIGKILSEMNPGDELKLGSIGVFTLRMTKEGNRRNPKTQEVVHVMPKKAIKFRLLPKFRIELNK